jgi:streptogramin lyase
MGTGDGVTFFALDPSGMDLVQTGRIDFAPRGYTQQRIAFDDEGNLYIDAQAMAAGSAAAAGRVDAFRAGASGAATPFRTLLGAKTELANVRALVVDVSGYLYVAVANQNVGSVLAFAPAANGDEAPIWSIKPGGHPSGLALDKSRDLFVADSENSPIAVFAPQATGPTTPIRSIGKNFGDPSAVAVDSNGRVYVSEWHSDSIVFFDANPSAPSVPAIQGPLTGISAPVDVAVDAKGRIAVANQGGGVEIFAAGATGNVAPLRKTLGGTSVAFSH